MGRKDKLSDILPNNLGELHHAYCIEGGNKNTLKELIKFFENDLRFKTTGNPDFYYGNFETLGIDDGRLINEIQSRKAIYSSKRIFVISANFITKEAQNSLLKMFEEPAFGSIFFLLVPSASILLPTLRSRLLIVDFRRLAKQEKDESALESSGYFISVKKFIEATLAERLSIVKDIADRIAKEEMKRSFALEFLNAIEKGYRDKVDMNKTTEKNLFVFDQIDKCRNYAGDRSPSVKMLLEHIAVIV